MEQTLAEQAYESIKRDVLTGVLVPGERIARPKLAQKYGVGAMPMREALQRLAREGFVQSVPRYGYIVTPITLSDVYEIYEVRSIIETGAARLAATRAPEERLRRIVEIAEGAGFTYVLKDYQSYSDFLAQNADFHLTIAAAAGNQRLVDLLSRLLDELMRVFHLYLDMRDYTHDMREEHLALAKALYDREPERAEQMVREQVERSFQRVLEALEHSGAMGHTGMVSRSIQVRGRRL